MAKTPVLADHHFRYAIGVGSNRGDRQRLIAQAAQALTRDGSCILLRQSALQQTQPVGGPGGQGAFLNGAWLVATSLGPHQLLACLQRIEAELGRVRTVRWGARTIDLDLLLREDGLEVSTPVLSLPHPRLSVRAFVLQPLAEVAPLWTIAQPHRCHAADEPGAPHRHPSSCPPRRVTIAAALAQLMASQQGVWP